MLKTRSGFTIVELLVVIVVIAILATISIVAYGGVQSRARDSKRVSDLRAIASALEQYKIIEERYPAVSGSGLGLQSSTESSAREAEGEFLAPLEEYGFSNGVPVDPINNATENTLAGVRANESYGYSYYVYPAGQYGCDPSRGRYYTLMVITTETYGRDPHPDSPGFSCSLRDWQTDYSWIIGGYEN